MILRFIGKDGSMGLRHGVRYRTSIKSEGIYIIVTWTNRYGNKRSCPYSSPQSFAENWEK